MVIKQMPTPKTDAEASQEAKDREEKTANDRKLVEFTRDLVIVTAILAIIGGLQLLVFGYQAIQLQRTVQATKKSADAALKNAQAVIDAERAWIDVGLKPRGGLYFELLAINFGKTPAKIVEHYLKWDFPPSTLKLPSAEELFAPAIKATVTHNRMLAPAPHDEWWSFDTFNVSAVLGADQMGKLRTGQVGLVVYGALRYLDVVSGAAHETTFCYFYSMTNNDLISVRDPAYRRYT